MFQVLILNAKNVWAALPGLFDTAGEAWALARISHEFRAVRIVQVVGEIERAS